MTDAELLAILLRIGNEGASAINMGRELIARLGGLQGIDRAHAEDIMQIKGLGLSKTAQLNAAIEIGKRVRRLDVKPVSFDSAVAIAGIAIRSLKVSYTNKYWLFCLTGRTTF